MEAIYSIPYGLITADGLKRRSRRHSPNDSDHYAGHGGNVPKKSYLLEKFISMRINKKVVLNDLSYLLKSRFSDNLKDIVLFGSQLYGKVHKDSDYAFMASLVMPWHLALLSSCSYLLTCVKWTPISSVSTPCESLFRLRNYFNLSAKSIL